MVPRSAAPETQRITTVKTAEEAAGASANRFTGVHFKTGEPEVLTSGYPGHQGTHVPRSPVLKYALALL